MKKIKQKKQKGQALITLLFITVIAITISSAAIIVLTLNSRASQRMISGNDAYFLAESGIENAMIRLLRDPTYTGETLTLADGTVEVTVTGDSQKTVVAKGSVGDYIRTIQVVVERINGVFTISSWKEVY